MVIHQSDLRTLRRALLLMLTLSACPAVTAAQSGPLVTTVTWSEPAQTATGSLRFGTSSRPYGGYTKVITSASNRSRIGSA